MTQKTIKIFIDEIHSKPPKRIIPQAKLKFFTFMTFGI